MIKSNVSLLLVFISFPSYSMDVFTVLQEAARSCDYSKEESHRGWVGGAFRYLLKEWGSLDADLIGLGNTKERERTLKILADLQDNPGSQALQKQYGDRQAIASHFAYGLIAQLEEFAKKCARSDNTSAPQLDMFQESPGLLKLIKISMELRSLHHNETLAPACTLRLIRATNRARHCIKTRLSLTDSSGIPTHNRPSEQDLLKEENELDGETVNLVVQSLSDEVIIQRTITLLKATIRARRNSGPSQDNLQINKELFSLAMQLANPKDIMAHAHAIADARGAELKLVKKKQTDEKKN